MRARREESALRIDDQCQSMCRAHVSPPVDRPSFDVPTRRKKEGRILSYTPSTWRFDPQASQCAHSPAVGIDAPAAIRCSHKRARVDAGGHARGRVERERMRQRWKAGKGLCATCRQRRGSDTEGSSKQKNQQQKLERTEGVRGQSAGRMQD